MNTFDVYCKFISFSILLLTVVLTGSNAFLENPPTSPHSAIPPGRTTSTATTTPGHSYDGHCTCNVNVHDIPASTYIPTSASTCTPDDAMKIKLMQLETNFNKRLQTLTDENASLKQALSLLQTDVTSVKGISSELQCARSTALSIENDVNNLLNQVLVNGSVIQPRHCLPVVIVPHLTQNTTYPRDCLEVLARNQTSPGVYDLQPTGSSLVFKAYCEHGWTFIQRRFDDSLNFEKDWDDYLMGFGDPSGEYWLGLEHLHYMTMQNSYTLRVNMTGWTGKSYWGQYGVFTVSTEQNNYELVASNYTGNYNDGMSTNGTAFSTRDEVNYSRDFSCPGFSVGWWRSPVCGTDLNGDIIRQSISCMSWAERCMKNSVMKIIPTNAVQYL